MGPTGTGKTMTIADKLGTKMPKEYIPEFMVFSAKTSANQTQDLIDGKLDKRCVYDGVEIQLDSKNCSVIFRRINSLIFALLEPVEPKGLCNLYK